MTGLEAHHEISQKLIRLAEVDAILKSRLDHETYRLVVEVAELTGDIAVLAI